jgi:hypothetical protein
VTFNGYATYLTGYIYSIVSTTLTLQNYSFNASITGRSTYLSAFLNTLTNTSVSFKPNAVDYPGPQITISGAYTMASTGGYYCGYACIIQNSSTLTITNTTISISNTVNVVSCTCTNTLVN